MVTKKIKSDNGRVSASDPNYGRFFGLFSLTGETSGVLSVFMRMAGKKHYTLYERRAFLTAAEAGRYLNRMEKTARMFVVNSQFE